MVHYNSLKTHLSNQESDNTIVSSMSFYLTEDMIIPFFSLGSKVIRNYVRCFTKVGKKFLLANFYSCMQTLYTISENKYS